MVGEYVLGLGKDIFNEGGRDDAQGDFAVDAAEGKVVDLIAEGRNVGALGGIDFHGQNVFAVEVDMRR